MKKQSITLVGQFPPPNGGISIPVKKIYKRIKKSEEFLDVNVVDISYDNKYINKGNSIYTITGNKICLFLKTLWTIFKKKNNIVHFHVAGFGMFFLVGHFLHYVCKDKVTIITIHGGDFCLNYKNSNNLKKYLIYKLIKKFDKVITVNVEQRKFLKQKLDINSKVIPVFDTPQYNEEIVDLDLKEDILEFNNKFDKVIIFTGMMLKYYGLEVLLNTIKHLIVKEYNLGLIIVLYGRQQDNKFNQKIDKLLNELRGNTKLLNKLEQNNFYYLLNKADIFIRPTFWDGDSSALREAAYFGNQVIASDCTWRPNKVITFKNKSYKDLSEKLIKVIKNEDIGKLDNIDFDNTANILELYRTINKKQ
ncbi:glycosyltransferase family 4 protein [Orenia marismortui]|uniref:glycosyltransferase family 4 protein n=1 Tax=Orenia marismortui TaxID=46469 RepID=UPI00037867F1|nr:glycosyltransferase [Orenia marismortui]